MKCIVIVDSPEVKEERGKVSDTERAVKPLNHMKLISQGHTWYEYNLQGLPYVFKDGGSQDGFRHLFNV